MMKMGMEILNLLHFVSFGLTYGQFFGFGGAAGELRLFLYRSQGRVVRRAVDYGPMSVSMLAASDGTWREARRLRATCPGRPQRS